MSDTEVESILREIREQVYAQRGEHVSEPSESARDRIVAQNGAHRPEITPQVDRLRAQTPILARSWDRLPPIISNRRGVAAKLELWVKSKARVLMRWFTWEQVNFNAAVHQSVLETIAQLEDINHQLREHWKEAQATNELVTERLSKLDQFRNAAEYQLGSIDRAITKLEESFDSEQRKLSTQIDEAVKELRDTVKGLRDADERLAQEQRVCFKQLSLESSETAVIIDRTRRKLDERLAELDRHAVSDSKVVPSSTKASSSQK